MQHLDGDDVSDRRHVHGHGHARDDALDRGGRGANDVSVLARRDDVLQNGGQVLGQKVRERRLVGEGLGAAGTSATATQSPYLQHAASCSRSRAAARSLAAPRVAREVETAAVIARIDLELPGKIHEAVLRHWQVAAAGRSNERRRGQKGAGQATHTALPRALPHQATVRFTSTFSCGGRTLNLAVYLKWQQSERMRAARNCTQQQHHHRCSVQTYSSKWRIVAI